MKKNRKHIGKNWNKKLIRGIQCILLATRGLVTPRKEFFEAAFGPTYEEFLKIVLMPEEYIIYRRKHEKDGAFDWRNTYEKLSCNERNVFMTLISDNEVHKQDNSKVSSGKIKQLLNHYIAN